MERAPVNCLDVSHNLPWYVGGDLDEAVMVAVAAHLGECTDCEAQHRRALDARTRLLEAGLCQDASSGQAPDLWPGVRARLVESGVIGAVGVAGSVRSRYPNAGPKADPDRPIFRPRFGTLRAAAAAAVLLFAVTRWSGWGIGEDAAQDSENSSRLAEGPQASGFGPTPVEPLSSESAPADRPAVLTAFDSSGVVPLRRVNPGEESVLDRYHRTNGKPRGVSLWPGAAPDGTTLTSQPIFGRPRLR
jgi:hypothetical protein